MTISLWKSKATKKLWTLEMIQSLDRKTASDIAKLLGIFEDALPAMKDWQIPSTISKMSKKALKPLYGNYDIP